MKRLKSPSIRSRRRVRHAVPAAELLETRALLSNVQISLAGSTLNINGDAGDNTLSIEQDGNEVIFAGHDGTTVNGEDTLVLELDEDTSIRRVNMRMRGGDDIVAVDSISQNGQAIDALIVLGGGNDFLIGESVDVNRIRVLGGPGNDAIGFRDSSIGALNVNSGPGHDIIGLEESVVGSLFANTGSGNDAVGLDAVLIEGRTWVNTGSGSDGVGVLDSDLLGRTSVRTGGGSDFMAVNNSFFGDSVAANLGGGADDLSVMETDFNDAVFATGAGGRDRVHVEDTFFDSEPRVVSFTDDPIDNLFEKLDDLTDTFDIFE